MDSKFFLIGFIILLDRELDRGLSSLNVRLTLLSLKIEVS